MTCGPVRKIAWWEPRIEAEEPRLVAEVLESNFTNDGGVTSQFENAIAARLGVAHAVGVTSGTAALFLALKALEVSHGDEIIVPDITFVASANAVTMTGARPVFVDVDPDTLNMSPEAIPAAITSKTKAIMPVHVSGRGANMIEIMAIADAYGLRVVEDAAEAFGSRIDLGYLGGVGDMGCFSFSPNKMISCGQGGAVITDDGDLHRRLRQLKDQGRPVRGTGGDDTHPAVGFNFKLTNLQAALGVGQMAHLNQRLETLRCHYRQYQMRLANQPGIRILKFDVDGGETPQWIDALVDDRNGLDAYLATRGIECRRFWHPIHSHLPYACSDADFPQSTQLCRHAIWLPSAFTLSADDIDFVCDTILEFVAR